MKYLENNKIKTFAKHELGDINNNYSRETIFRALKILKDDGVLDEAKAGKNTKYVFNSELLEHKEQDAEKQEEKEQKTL